jgi:hypothetical protein
MSGGNQKVHAEVVWPAFSKLCLAMGVALVAAKFAAGVETGTAGADEDAPVYSISARVDAESGRVAAEQLKVGGIKISQGQDGVVEFATDAQGVARIPLSISRPKPAPRRSAFLVHQMPYDKVSWSGSGVVLGGLRPNAQYEMEVSLWLRASPEGGAARGLGQDWAIRRRAGPSRAGFVDGFV